jgi:biotin-(acetyl-CoA carboxylase) ligase
VECEALDARLVALAEHRERTAVAGLGAGHENGIGEPLVDEWWIAGLSWVAAIGDSTVVRGAWLQGRSTLMGMALVPELVLPRLRGRFGRVYLHAMETPSTQTMLPDDAPHGAVAVAEHQTSGRGRLGRVWVDEPGSGLAVSIVLRPPGPLVLWPELTLVAAHAVASAVGSDATIKDPNDVLVGGRKVAGILAEASDRVVLGIGVNVGAAPFPGSGFVECDRLELLVSILAEVERGYDAWVEAQADAQAAARITTEAGVPGEDVRPGG